MFIFCFLFDDLILSLVLYVPFLDVLIAKTRHYEILAEMEIILKSLLNKANSEKTNELVLNQ